MATIQIKRNNSNAATKPSSLLVGELAGNLLDRSLFSSDGSNVFQFYTGTTKWFDTSGNANNANKLGSVAASSYATQDWVTDKKYLTTHQSIYSFTINNSAGTAQVTYTPNSKAASLTLTKSMVGLSNVENTALSTWAGSSKITTLGTITSGTWNGTKIANSYLANSSMTIAGTSVSLGSSITAATLKTNLGLGSLAYKSSLVASDIPSLDWSKITSGKPTTLAGYGITDAISTSGGTISGNIVWGKGKWGVDASARGVFMSWNDSNYLHITNDGAFYNWNTLIHSGNISSQKVERARYIETSNYTGAGWYGDSYKLYAKWFNDTICDWKSTDDANNEYKVRVDIAKKLDTARTIWGQSFDGSANVSGKLHLDQSKIYWHNDANNYYIGTYYDGTTNPILDVKYYGGIRFFTNAAERMRIATNGNVLIGTTTDSGAKLQVSGNITATGDGVFGSDARYKSKIQDLAVDVETIANAPVFSYKWIDREDDKVHLGTTAQYWLNTNFKDAVDISNKDFFHLNYGALGVAIGVSLAKKTFDHEERIKALEKENKELKNELKQLKQWHN